ncbi:MAG: transglycosylase SLT domain-containing protein [Afipia sp.]
MKVPTYDTPQVGANIRPAARLDAPAMPDVAGQQLQQTGQALSRAGLQMQQIEIDRQNEINQLKFDDAANRAKEAALRLKHDPQAGFFNLKGSDAYLRPDGKDLATEYGDNLRKELEQVSAGLDNDAQRQAFTKFSENLLTGFRAEAMAHDRKEFVTHSLSVSEGIMATAMREISLNWDKPETIDQAQARIEAETYRQAKLQGKSAEWQEATVRKLTSGAHILAVKAALENNNPVYAASYMKKYASKMEADDIMKANAEIGKQADLQIGVGLATQAVQQAAPKLAPTDADRAFNILLGTESGGKQFAANGQPLTSPKGAIGIAQVMPGTAPEAAKLAGLPWDENRYRTDPEYNKALGRAYFTKQLQDFGGDLSLAYAAYNAGPGAVRKALSNSQKPVMVNASADPNAPKQISWLSLLPQETQQYVAKNMAAFNGGAGQPARPTLADIDAQLMSNPAIAGNPQRLKIAREEAARQWKVQEDAIKQREEEGTSNAMRMLVANGGRFADLPASVRNAIPPKEVDNVLGFGVRVAKGEDITSPLLYAKLSADPAQLGRMSDAQFFMLRRELSETDFKHFANERAKQMGGAQGANGPGDINSGAIKQTLDARMRMLGIDPTPKDDGGKDAARVGAIRQFVDQYFIGAQREAGKKFTDAEVAQHLDGLFAKNATFRGWFSDSSGPMLGMKAGDIPSADRDALKAAFKRRGVDEPTDAQILNAYWTMKVAKR